MPVPPPIEWRLHLASPAEAVFDAWTTDEGRKLFWAESSLATEKGFRLDFVNGQSLDVELIETARPSSADLTPG